MKSNLILFLFLGLTFGSSAQVNVSIVKDSPEDLSIYRIKIPLWCGNLNNYNTSIYDFRLGVDIQPMDKLLISGDYSIGIGDQVLPESSAGLASTGYPVSGIIVPQTVMASSRQLDVQGTYFFSSKIREKQLAVTLKSSGNVEYYTTVPGQELVRYGVRLGMRGGSTWYHMGDADIQYSEDLPQMGEEAVQDKSTMLRYRQLRVGFAYARTTNLWVQAEGYGMRSNTGTLMYYADLFVGMKSEVDDVYFLERGFGSEDSNDYYYYALEINEQNEKSKLGFEIGLQLLPTAGLIGYTVALGRINGIKGSSNGYVQFGLFLSLGNRERMKEGSGESIREFDSRPRK